MVLPAVLRDPARDPVKARRRHRDVLVDCYFRLPAVARYVARPLGSLSARIQGVLLGICRDGYRARLSWLTPAGGRVRDRRANPNGVLLPPPPRHHPAP